MHSNPFIIVPSEFSKRSTTLGSSRSPRVRQERNRLPVLAFEVQIGGDDTLLTRNLKDMKYMLDLVDAWIC